MDLVVTLRSRFKAFATVCVFLSLKSCSSNRPVQTVLQSVPSLTVDDIAVFCGVLGPHVLRLVWDADQSSNDPDEGDIQLHFHLQIPQPEQTDQRPAKRQRRSQPATDPVRHITGLISLFDTRLDALIADSSCDVLFKRLARENLPLMPAADTTDLPMDNVVDELRRQPFYCGQIVESASVTEPAIEAQYASLKHPVDARIWAALRETRGIEQLYSHQAQAIDSIMGGSDVVVSTATASGKSIIYQLPIVDLLLRDPQARVLIIYPTKALAQDQLAALTTLVQNIPALRHVMVSTLDGDTPSGVEGSGGSQRAVIRQQASVILTNPDTLHVAMLPGVERWRAFWAGLRMVVVDELHVYQGRFGQHMAHILSRLQRLTATHFQFVACTATTSNAQAHMQQLTHRANAAIGADGSPHGTRHLLLWDALQSKGGFSDTALLAAYLLRRGKRALVFCRTRAACELAQREIIDYLNASGLRELRSLVMSYRGGYSPRERREIEAAMFAGHTRIVVATSALELGIDVGALDAVIIVGVPMTNASMWQQIGRAGRRSQTSLALVIATGAPADRCAVKDGAGVFGRCFAPAEIAEEINISAAHLRCAAFERPIDMDVDSAFIGDIGATKELVQSTLTWDAATQRWACPLSYKPWPAARVSIRSTPLTDDAWQVVVVIANETNRKINGRRVLEEMDAARALFALYVGGIFLHRGLAYTIDVVDVDTRTALVTPANVSWHTIRRELTEVIPALALASARPWPHIQYTYGEVEIGTTGVGYRRIDSRTRKVVETVDHASPRQSAKSRGVWIDVPADISRRLMQSHYSVAASIHGAQHALLAAICNVMGCASTQLSTACSGREMPQCDKPLCLVVFELANAEDGVLKRSVLKAREVLECAYQRVAACLCDGGCTDCIHLAHGCREQNQGTDRAGAKLVLEWVVQDVFKTNIATK